MMLASPIWLIGLLPWAGVVIWMLLGKRLGVTVPFIELWRGAREPARGRRQITRPSAAVMTVLGAILLAILAAARPALRRANAAAKVTVIVDRGITMAPKGRMASAEEALRDALVADAQVDLVAVPRLAAVDWGQPFSLPETCVDTSSELNQAVSAALPRSDGAVIVLTDKIVRDDPRVIRIAPKGAVENVAITRFAIREDAGGKPQAMVTLRNDSNWLRARLSVADVKQELQLPPRGQVRSYFVELPTVAATAKAVIDVDDEFDGDNVAYLARQPDRAAIELRGTLSADVRRMVEAYRAARRARDANSVVAVVGSADQLKNTQAGIIAPAVGAAEGSQIGNAAKETIAVQSHPVTENLNGNAWQGLRFATPPTGDRWVAVVSQGGHPLVSIREQPARQVWIGIASSEFARSGDFVILWTNALEWVSGGGKGDSFAAGEVGTLGAEWEPEDGRHLWPGFYRRSDGAVVALNAPTMPIPAAAPTPDWQAKLARLAGSRDSRTELGSYLAGLAIGCALLAACIWPGGRSAGRAGRILTAFSAARTVS